MKFELAIIINKLPIALPIYPALLNPNSLINTKIFTNMKNFQTILFLGAALISVSQGIDQGDGCQDKEESSCAVYHCNDANEKNCVWNKPANQCQCPHEGGDTCSSNDNNGPVCVTQTCVNGDGAQINCVFVDQIDASLPGFLQQRKKVCVCPLTCSEGSIDGKSTCDPEAACGTNKVCINGLKQGEEESCGCHGLEGAPCDCNENDCAEDLVCVQEIVNGEISSTCQPQGIDSPCSSCDLSNCGTTDFVCKNKNDLSAEYCGVCKVAMGDCCRKTSDCVDGICNGNKKCKYPLDAPCQVNPDQCDNKLGLTCQETSPGVFTCRPE